ncbi:class I SAM-dependent methyltransferase [Candidatus Woesearchaeota archaeon]|nr:class I SAM-dependent methyltransferase [Candidatus Woesearchaeota archaeon]
MRELIKNSRNLHMYRIIYGLFRHIGLIDLESLRKKLLPKLKGKVLDIGVGDAGNYRYYSKGAKVTILDFEKKMLELAKKTVSDKKNYTFIHADAQDLSMLKKSSFDAVVVVFIYCCSVKDSVAALKEAKRVLKKNGRMIVIAHVLSKNWLIKLHQYVMEPFSRLVIGSDMTRDTKSDILNAGFKIVEEHTTGWTDVFKVFIAKRK